jgi:hypothetical protein
MTDQQREHAIERIEQKRDFKTHALVYVLVNIGLVTIWAFQGGGYFWPIWVILGWGIGLAAHAYFAFSRRPGISEEQIQREIDRGP